LSDTELETDDLFANAELFASSGKRSRDAVITSEKGDQNILAPAEYQRMMRELNEKQLQIVIIGLNIPFEEFINV
jgi:hypothetical protein